MTAPGDPSAGGIEGPEGHEVSPVDDRRVPLRVFLGIGVFLGVIFVIYVPSFEEAGIVMLGIAAVLGLWIGAFLWLQERSAARVPAGDAGARGEDGEYLPHASVWPFAIGVGGALIFNGLVLGIWVIVPGVLLLGLGVGGFVAQTRRRD